MISRPSWERPLRQKLRKWRKPRLKPRWLTDHGWTLLILFSLQCVLGHGGEEALGPAGGGTGIGAVSGLVGAFLSISLRSRWLAHGWLLDWTPATPLAAWKLRTREHLPTIIIAVLVTLLLSCLAAAFNDHTSTATALAATTLSMACGFILAGGKISTRLLYAGVVLIFFYTVLSGWFGSEKMELSIRMAKGTSLLWLPILPWSFVTHGSPVPALHLGVLLTALLISIYEWRRAWSYRSVAAGSVGEIAIPTGHAPEEPTEEPDSEEEEAPTLPDEEQRQNVRQHVAFAWFGMAGYMPDGPMPRFEQLLWRWLSPRQRFLSCLGSEQAATWFPRTRWAAITLAVMVALALLVPRLDGEAWIDHYGFWVFAGFLGLASIAGLTSWPGRDSGFQSWLDLMQTADLGLFPSFAVLPVTAGEWFRAFAKEWTIRSAWFASMWSVAILLAQKGINPDADLSWQIAFATVPWLIVTAWFPLTVLHRLVRAVSGPAFRSHGITRVVPALVSGVLGLISATIVFVGIGAGMFLMTALSLVVAAVLGAFSLWLTLQRCRGMRLDIKPTPLA